MFLPAPFRLSLVLLACSLALAPVQAATAPPSARPAKAVPGKAKPVAPVAAPVVTAVTAPVRAEFVRELGGIEEYRLPNGLQILLFPDEAQSTTTVNITYRVGSRHESQGEFGMAHLLEHLIFKGTPTHRDIPGAFAERGVRFNGTTTADRTNYFASFNASEDTLAYVLGLEADRMVNSFIAKSDLDKEMSVVRNEFERGETEPMQVLFKRVQAVAYDWHPYGNSTIGPKSDIENVPIERLQAFYKRFYRPDNATVLVAGRFDKAAVLQRIATQFGPLARPAQPLPVLYTEEPAQDGERTVTVRRVGGQPTLLAYYHVPAIAHADSAPLLVLSLLMSMPPSGQLYKELVESKLAINAGLFGLGNAAPGGISALAIPAKQDDFDKVEKLLLDLVEGRSAKPFEDSELQRVREVALNSYRQQMKNPEALIQQISGLLGAGDWRLLFQLMEDLPRVTLTDVERVRKAYLQPANRTLGRFVPAKEVARVEIPAAPPLDQRLAELKGPPKVEDGERFDPTPEHLAERTRSQTLPSGIELHTLSKRTRGNSVHLQLELRWGERDATFARRGTGLISELMLEGSRSLDKQALQDRLIRLKAGLSISGADQGAVVNITAESDSLLETLDIVAGLLQQPLLPADAFDRIVKRGISRLEGARSELETLRQEAVREHYNFALGVVQGQPDYQLSIAQRLVELRAIRLDDLRSFHADYWSANEARVSAVGPLPAGLAERIEALFGAWKKPAAPRFVRYEAKHINIPPARFDVPAKDKANAILRMRLEFPLNELDPDYFPLVLASQIFGAGGMESRLASRVRQQEGLSYGVGASLGVPRWGNDATLSIGGSFAPQNRDKVLALIDEELVKMATVGVSEAELARAKKDVLEGRLQGRADDGQLTATLSHLAERGEGWPAVAQREAQIRAVTLEQVNTAWARHIKRETFVISTAGDF
ncbi:insulinase family protein [Paucibacter sp. DJ1R-11]|uniref:M16 family metallopeptidase n=1 Tax=Paucibacter sp. DJ1R-11 TaxID=2893556 RepID=UPI0021E42E8E|nr:pitrilysin family protein [Paucibacter sp. DJ1R-11]MCV2363290.1 insulinase family protein [Paucibacter sp. DJ1R-11]